MVTASPSTAGRNSGMIAADRHRHAAGHPPGNVGAIPGVLGTYPDAGVQHVMAALEDREIDACLATAEAF